MAKEYMWISDVWEFEEIVDIIEYEEMKEFN